MTKENIYYMDDNAFDRFYKRARYQANSFVAGKLGSKAADYLTTLPDFAYLICKLMLDPDVPSSRKLDLGFALLYVLSPLDLVPDSFPLLGKIDDAYAILVSVAKLLRSTDRNIILRHWLGDPETIDTVRAWLNYFDEKLGSGLMKKIHHLIKPLKRIDPFLRLIAVPAQMPQPHRGEPGALHQFYVRLPALLRPIMGMIVRSDIQ